MHEMVYFLSGLSELPFSIGFGISNTRIALFLSITFKAVLRRLTPDLFDRRSLERRMKKFTKVWEFQS